MKLPSEARQQPPVGLLLSALVQKFGSWRGSKRSEDSSRCSERTHDCSKHAAGLGKRQLWRRATQQGSNLEE